MTAVGKSKGGKWVNPPPRLRRALASLERLRRPYDPPAHIYRAKGDRLELFLQGEIGKYNSISRRGILTGHVVAALAKHPRIPEIEVTINSVGGRIIDGLKIYRALRSHGAHVTTIADEMCASAATLVLVAGDLRLAWPGSRLMLHRPASAEEELIARWTSVEHRRRAQLLEQMDSLALDIYSDRCGNRPFFERERKTENYLPMFVAKAHGLIHGLVGEV